MFLIDELQEFDRLSIITFNSEVDNILKLNPLTERNKRNFKSFVESLDASGNTNLRSSIETAMEIVYER